MAESGWASGRCPMPEWCVVCGTFHTDPVVELECKEVQAEFVPNPSGRWPE
jgi:hypothetical protein